MLRPRLIPFSGRRIWDTASFKEEAQLGIYTQGQTAHYHTLFEHWAYRVNS